MRVKSLPISATKYHRSAEMLRIVGVVKRPVKPVCRDIGHNDNQNVSKRNFGLRITE